MDFSVSTAHMLNASTHTDTYTHYVFKFTASHTNTTHTVDLLRMLEVQHAESWDYKRKIV